MALVHQGFYVDLLAGNVVAAPDLRVRAVMSNTTCDTEADVSTFSGFTTIDECDGVGYAERDLANVSVAYDSANDRLLIDADDYDLDGGGGSVAASSRQVVGLVYYRYVDGTDANDVPWFYVGIGPYTMTGGAFDITVHADGIANIALAP